jgi:hypothetical protein
MLVHTLYEIALLVTAWRAWDIAYARWWIITALTVHFSARVWSFAYFIPRALQFEKLGDLTEKQERDAWRWTRLSRFRPMLEAVSVMAQCIAVLHLVQR